MTRSTAMDANTTNQGAGALSINTILSWLGAAVSGALAFMIRSARKEGRDEARVQGDRKLQDERDDSLREDLALLRDDLKASVAELRTMAVAHAKRDGEQDAVNRMVTTTLEGLSRRLDRHEEVHKSIDARLNDHGSSLTLMRTILEERAKREGKEGSL